MVNTDTKLSVLACILYSRDAAKKVMEYCRATDFPDRYQHIYTVAHRMVRDNKVINMITLLEEAGHHFGVEIAVLGQYSLTDVDLVQKITYIVRERLQQQLISIDPHDGELDRILSQYQAEMLPEQAMEVIRPQEVLGSILEYYETGGEKTYTTGFNNIDQYYRISKKQLTIVTGMPGSGKSEFLDHMAVNLAKNEGWKFLYFSPENFPPERHIAKLIEKWTGWPFRRGPMERISKQHVIDTVGKISEYFSFIRAQDDNRTLRYIIQTAKKKACDGFIIDPWNEIEHLRPESMTETEYIGLSLADMKAFAVNHDAHVWLVAHPKKMVRDKEGNYPVPNPYDISGSAHFRNKADNCLTVYRPDAQVHGVEVHIQKIRFKDNGKLGMTKLGYDVVTGKFKDR